MYRLQFTNSDETPYFLQVDPWAGLYRIEVGRSVTLEADSGEDIPVVEFDQKGDTRFVTLVNSSEYYVIVDGKRLHWTDYPNNVRPGETWW